MSKCLFCLEPVVKAPEDPLPNLQDVLESLADSCFQEFRNTAVPRKILWPGLKEGSFCSSCYNKLLELYHVRENLKKIEQQLNQLIKALETAVIDSYKEFKEPDDKESSISVAKLRMKFYKLGVQLDLEENAEIPKTEDMTLTPSVDSYGRDSGDEIASHDDEDDLWTHDESKILQARKIASVRLKRFRARKRKPKAFMTESTMDPRLGDSQPILVLSIPKIEVEEGNYPRLRSQSLGLLPQRHDEHSYQIADEDEDEGDDLKINSRKKSRYSKPEKSVLRCTSSGCTKVFRREASRFSHIRYDHEGVKKPFHCDECDFSCITGSALAGHQKSHKNSKPEISPNPFPCTIANCTKSFSSESTRFVHIKRFHEGVNSYKCSYCDKTYGKPAKLRVHERIHTGELPFECSTCQKRFSAKPYLRQHMSLHMNKFSCEICGKPSTSRLALKFHMGTHTAAKPFVCEICGYSCTTKQYLETHQANSHPHETGLESIKCHVCDRTLSSKKSLENHLFSIHKIGQAKFQCEYCEAQWNSLRELKVHTNNVHLDLKKHECMVCHKKFSTQANVRTHHERHHMAKSERPRPFPCPKCPKCFFAKRTMENHMAIHSGDRPFQCDLCDQRFPTRSYLDLHKYTIHQNRKNKKKPQIPKSNQIEESVLNVTNNDKSPKFTHFMAQPDFIIS